MSNFNLLDPVFIKSLKKEGLISKYVGIVGNSVKYEVIYDEDDWAGAGFMFYLATKSVSGIFDENDLDSIRSESKSVPKCECGKEKHGFASHANWCAIKE
jgi:hypothetical protein